MGKPTVLIVDDEELATTPLSLYLTQQGATVFVEPNGKKALDSVTKHHPKVVITDYKMPEMDGLAFLKAVKSIEPDVPVIILTAYHNKSLHLEFLKEGAYRYLTKPYQPEELVILVNEAAHHYHLVKERKKLHYLLALENEFPEIIGQSQAIKNMFSLVAKVSRTDATVLIEGETGTGKELIAKAIHEVSLRKGHPFIRFNCAALTETLIESELFGYEKGAFTGADHAKPGRFELANSGTLFFDEIGELSLNMQVKFLRVIQEKEFERVGGTHSLLTDVRFIAATNRNLSQMVQKGTFREDLYYRLNSFPIQVPSLRERRSDISLLVEHFLVKFSREHKISRKKITPEALEILKQYNWKGNIRELQNVISRALILSDEAYITEAHLPSFEMEMPLWVKTAAHQDLTEEELVCLYAKKIYEKYKFNKKETAKILNINFRTLNRRLT